MNTKVDLKLHQLNVQIAVHLTLLFASSFYAATAADDGTSAETNLTIISHEDGTLAVSWKQPTVIQEGKTVTELQVDSYILSYVIIKSNKVPFSTTNVTTKETKVDILNAYLGISYQFNLFCVINGAIVKCNNQTVLSLPSCPNGWYQHQIQCYYISTLRKTWAAASSTCQALLPSTLYSGQEVPPSTPEQEINQMVADDIAKNGNALFWTPTEQCNKIPEENISKYNCCIALNTGDNATSLSNPFSTSSDSRQCSNSQELPFVCAVDVKVVTVKAENVTATMLTNNSVHVSWAERPNQTGWKLVWRTVTVYNANHQLVSTVEVLNTRRVANIPPLEPGQIYKCIIWPHKMGYVMQDPISTSFALIAPQAETGSKGGVLQLPVRMEARLRWDGTIRVTWDTAISVKEPNEESAADGYQLIYGFPNTTKREHTKVNLTLSDTFYDVTAVQAGQVYWFSLKCIFGTTMISCAKIRQLNIELPAKILAIGKDRYVAYDGSSPTDLRTWPEAEQECVDRGGHLLNIENVAEESNVSNIFSYTTVFWIKANQCVQEKTWSNGSNSNYNKAESSAINQDNCCIEIRFIMVNGIWEHTACNNTLPYACKYEISDLGILKNLTAYRISSTTVQLKWKTPNQLWRVSAYEYCVCERDTKCETHRGTATTSPITISGLSRKTNYTITVSATVDSLKTAVSSKTRITTGEDMEVTADVSENGKIQLDWPSEDDDNDASIVYIVQPQTDDVQPFRLTTSNMSIQGLEYGKEYDFTLLIVDNTTGDILDSVSFKVIPKPNCLKDEFQYGMKCYFIGNQSTIWEDGRNTCANRNGEATQIVSANETAFLRRVSADMDSPFWIDGQTSSAMYTNEDESVTKRERRQAASETGCRIITFEGENEGISVTQCGRRLPFMCQRQLTVDVGSVTNIVLEKVSTNAFALKWSSPPWKPSGYSITVTPTKQVTNSSHTGRRKRETAGNVIVDDKQNSATVDDLESATSYQVDITPVMNSPDSAGQIKGKTTSIQASTLDPNDTNLPHTAPLTSNPDNQDTGNNTTVGSEDDLHTFRIISCVCLIILTLIAFIVFAICRMYRYRDCISQMCFEVSLILAHMLILLNADTRDQIDCKAVAICIHFFFTAAFLFFALECFCHVKAMTKLIPLTLMSKTWQYFSVGWGVSVLIVVVSASSVHDDYVTKTQRHCWLNLNGDAMLATVIPIGIFAGMAFIFLCLAICARPESNYEVDEESYIRYEPLQDIRWMQLFLLVILVSHWAVGMVASHEEDGNLFIAFIVLTIILAITILMLRCIGDDEIRFRMKACFQGSPIGPGDEDIGKYLSKPYSKSGRSSPNGPGGGDGMLIVRKTYIFKP